jgi:hypothetical protein
MARVRPLRRLDDERFDCRSLFPVAVEQNCFQGLQDHFLFPALKLFLIFAGHKILLLILKVTRQDVTTLFYYLFEPHIIFARLAGRVPNSKLGTDREGIGSAGLDRRCSKLLRIEDEILQQTRFSGICSQFVDKF